MHLDRRGASDGDVLGRREHAEGTTELPDEWEE